MDQLPKYQNLIIPMLRILNNSDSAFNNQEIELGVADVLNIPETLRSSIHSGSRTELSYRLGWSRTKAKASGWVISPKREHWKITDLGKKQLL